jgi:hypothetical protein
LLGLFAEHPAPQHPDRISLAFNADGTRLIYVNEKVFYREMVLILGSVVYVRLSSGQIGCLETAYNRAFIGLTSNHKAVIGINQCIVVRFRRGVVSMGHVIYCL